MFKTGIQLYPSVKIYRFDDFFGEVLKVQLEIDKKKNLLTDSFAVDRYRYGLCADGIANVAAKAGAVERSEIQQK